LRLVVTVGVKVAGEVSDVKVRVRVRVRVVM